MNAKCFLIALLLIWTLMGYAQTESITNNAHGLGVNVNSLSGYGLSYRYYPSKFGVQFNGYGFKNKDVTRVVLGGSIMTTLKEGDQFRIFYHISAAEFYRTFKAYDCIPISGSYFYDCYEVTKFRKNFCIGTGAGIDYQIGRSIFSFWYGMGFYRNFSEFSMLGGGLSILYSF
jgi:hypothetical protein